LVFISVAVLTLLLCYRLTETIERQPRIAQHKVVSANKLPRAGDNGKISERDRYARDLLPHAWDSGILVPEVDRHPLVRQRAEVELLRLELEKARSELAQISKPLREDLTSSTVDAEIAPDETLVTGGYPTADGRYELTFLTPRSISIADGKDVIEVKASVLSVGQDFAKAHNLNALSTNARNTLQHAEAWKQTETTKTLRAASSSDEASLLSAPTITTPPETPCTIALLDQSGAGYSLSVTASRKPNGNFQIQSHIEKTSKTEPSAPLWSVSSQPASPH
jgi:hypothetical protein